MLHPEDMLAEAGDAAYLACVGYGIPSPNITWERNGAVVSNDSETVIHESTFITRGIAYVESVLEICNAGGMDSGEYSCLVENTVGSANASFELFVRFEGKKEYLKQLASCKQSMLCDGMYTVFLQSQELKSCCTQKTPRWMLTI